MSTTNDRLGKQALAVKEGIEEIGETVRDAAQEKLGQLREHASGYYEQGRDKVQGVLHSLEQSVGQRPLTSLFIAAGVGLLLGRFWSSMRR
jgi:ElaB/YqjD/DUF883 family membrane-anchored ribosome-binding protein